MNENPEAPVTETPGNVTTEVTETPTLDSLGRWRVLRPGNDGGVISVAVRDPREAEQKQAFLAAFLERGNAYDAAKDAGIYRATLYRWRDADPEFREAWDNAKAAAMERVEGSLFHRALYEKGMPGVTAAFGILRAHDPERWSPDRQAQVNITVEVQAAAVMQAANNLGITPALDAPTELPPGEPEA